MEQLSVDITSVNQLDQILGDDRPQYLELWLESPQDRYMSAFINGDVGWLMYLRKNGDAGFHTINPAYSGPPDEMIDYEIYNGQGDEYPASWAIPVSQIKSALRYFLEHGLPLRELNWNSDSSDGCVISEQNPTGDFPEGVTVDDSKAREPRRYDDLTLYIFNNYSHLITEQEEEARRSALIYHRGGPYGPEGVSQASLSDDEQVRTLGALDHDELVRRIVQRILTEHKAEVILNTCPKCGKFCRTPKARQCWYCHHDWH